MGDRFFASDNSATVHPAIMEALARANTGHAIGYGEDEVTKEAAAMVRDRFGSRAKAFFVYSGTGANVIGLQSALRSHEGVICTAESHINWDECGAVEKFTGSKLLSVPGDRGRLTGPQVESFLSTRGVVHHTQPRVVSLTQATEMGTVYPVETVREISEICKRHGMYLHMDGARISNAAVSLGIDLAAMTRELGVDILSLGGTKNGLMFGEAVIVWDDELAQRLHFAQKQGMQLASKMRYIAAPFTALFGTDLWRDNAQKANALASELATKVGAIDGAEVVYPVEANGVFVSLPKEVIPLVRDEVFFYDWEPEEGIVRFMVSFDNSPEDIVALEGALRKALESNRPT